MDMIEFFSEPLRYTFMQNAMLAAVLVGAICGVVGAFVVVRGMSFFGDALAHSILPGVSVAYIASGGATGNNLFLGGLVAGMLAALGIGWLTREGRLKEDTAIGVVFAAMFALGIAIISAAGQSYGIDLSHILFGYILGISAADLGVMAACGAVVVGVIVLLYKEFLVLSFDPGLARTLRLPSERLRLLLLVLIAVTVVASLRIVGVALVIALLVTPAAAAQLLTKRLHHMMIVAAALGMFSSVVGIYLSYYLDVATGAAIVLTATALFIVVFTVTRLRRWRRRSSG